MRGTNVGPSGSIRAWWDDASSSVVVGSVHVPLLGIGSASGWKGVPGAAPLARSDGRTRCPLPRMPIALHSGPLCPYVLADEWGR